MSTGPDGTPLTLTTDQLEDLRKKRQDKRDQDELDRQIIRRVVAKRLGIDDRALSNWTSLGDDPWSIALECERELGRSLPSGKTITAGADFVALLSAFRQDD